MENYSSPDSRESIWSIPKPFVFAYFGLVTLLGVPTLAVIIWEKAAGATGSWWQQPITVIRSAAPECGQVGIGIAVSTLFAVQGVAILMVLYQVAVNRWVKPVIKRHRDAGRAEGRAEGREEGRAEANLEWQAWLERKTEAENRGLPFDEPQPGDEQ